MSHYGRGCHISTIIMVPINFWRNFDLFFFKKGIFSSLKIDKVRVFQRESLNFFKENLPNTKQKSLKRFGATLMILGSRLSNFLGPLGSEMTYLGRSVTYQCCGAQCGGGVYIYQSNALIKRQI